MKTPIPIATQLAVNLDLRGYTALTPIQKAVLTNEMIGKDALVSAQTGSGKTVAFGLSISSNLLDKNSKNIPTRLPVALVIAPTRELALQVRGELEWLYAKTPVSIASCVGGMDMRTEKRNLKKSPNIILGTPGRLKDYIERKILDLSALKVVVLDEADEMLNLGFREELEFILGSTPNNRRTLLFSATISKGIEKLASRYQNNALRISTLVKSEQHLDIEYHAITVASGDTEHAIMNILRYHEANNSLVFCGTRANVNHLASRLNNRGFSVVSLSGELSQKERLNALRSMRNGLSNVCVATDVAARGIDLPNLELVIHADLPKTKESLVHRSGRTGRAGNKGISVLMVPLEYRKKVQRLLDNAKIKAIWKNPPNREDIIRQDNQRLMQDLMLSEKPTTEENALISLILEKHNTEEIARTLIRSFRKNKYAPDDLRGTAETKTNEIKRNGIKKSAWFKLSVGSNQKAEPRWLLSKVSRIGKISKKDVGSIKIGKDESYVEINSRSLDKFLQCLEKNDELESGLKLVLLDQSPKGLSKRRPLPQHSNSKMRRKSRREKERQLQK